MERQVDVLRDRCEEIERADAQRRAEEEKKHAEDVSVGDYQHHMCTMLLLLIYAPIAPLLSPSLCLPPSPCLLSPSGGLPQELE